MIRDQWYAILDSRELPRRRPAGVVRLGERLALWRTGDGIACVADTCAHRGASLAAGGLCDGHIQCPFHGFRYDETGRCVLIPANGRSAAVPPAIAVKSYPAVERHGFIWIWWGESRKEYPPLPFFGDLAEGWSRAGRAEQWAVHYSRAIENQLDVVHLPFVHRSTIGRGGKTLVNGPRVQADDTGMIFWMRNDVDRGQRPLVPAEMPPLEDGAFHLHFLFPSIWQNWLSSKARIFLVFAPVDDEHTVIYLRFYQRFIRLPILRTIVNAIGLWYSIIILHQDRRVVETQVPRKSTLAMGERLIQGDLPIIEYRRIRARLQERTASGRQ